MEVARNPKLADDHPEWMASLGMHEDWRQHFPDARELQEGEVAKVWPWTPIAYREAFNAHLSRINRLLKHVTTGYRGLLLNDLQGGPSTCGCGNLQCRWAIDYGVPATTEKLPGADVATRFVAQVGKLAPGRTIVPSGPPNANSRTWPPTRRTQAISARGYCGDVDCFDNCRARSAEQWAALHATQHGPTGMLGLHKEFQRDRKEYGAAGHWITRAVDYLHGEVIEPISHQRLWLVVQAYGRSKHLKNKQHTSGPKKRLRCDPGCSSPYRSVLAGRGHRRSSGPSRPIQTARFPR